MYAKILEVIEGLNDFEIKKLWNDVAVNAGYESISDLNPVDFNEVLGSKSPWDLLLELDDNFDINDDYFYFDEHYNCYVSTNDIYDLVDDGILADLVRDIFDEGELDSYSDIPQEIIDLYEEGE